MKLKKYAVPLIFLFTIPQLTAQDLSIAEAVKTALLNNDRIKGGKALLAEKEADDFSAIGNFLPKINLTGSFNHLDKPIEFDLNPIRDVIIQTNTKNQLDLQNLSTLIQTGAPMTDAQKAAASAYISTQMETAIPSFIVGIKDRNNKSAAISAIQPLFTGGKLIAAERYADAERQSARFELKAIENEIIKETISGYLNCVFMEALVKTRQSVVEAVTRHKINADKLVKEGLIPNYHYYRAEVALSEAERNLEDDINTRELAYLSLKHVLGIEEDASIILSDSLFFRDIEINTDSLLTDARENQPILMLFREKKKAAAQNYNIQISNFFPTFAAFGKYELYPEHLSVMEPRWVVGLSLQFNLFNGLKDYFSVQKAKYIESRTEAAESDTQRKISLWISKSAKEALNMAGKYKRSGAAEKTAIENLRMNESRFNSGLGTSLEVIDAQVMLEKIRTEKLSSLLGYYKSLSELYQAAGTPEKVLSIWNNRSNQ